ncbi:colanic acid/amylovoran biosynthesis protein [Desulfocicer vacuolatum DSM 3385]|uniref:Colanic acid/amylovoran biosynthesis protein n=1 Tax=Desulfocicer vacuolatum DSM 3385 TaxID=1121400 RepID=A0A1W2BJT9_9BACT|nr:polysaccharide pyruvyl transferase family protein [Desulfocicer vacuolatum]SMC73010.1 colanic acid/amylovoran biosynthesis protein [Desulfocicer vacuolatum DSM 3385]
MLIEIRGVSFKNKGSELMLRSIVTKLREKIPNINLLMVNPLTDSICSKRVDLGFHRKLCFQIYGSQWGFGGALIPKALRQKYHMVLDSEVDVVLDASGFAYSDQWGTRATIAASKVIRKWKEQKTKVILMPQAFGPFTGKKIQSAFKIIVENSDLIFARDQHSYKHVTQLVGKREHIRIAPDFTNLINGDLSHDFDMDSNRFCIIPNYRMIDKTINEERDLYIPFLINCVKYLYEKGANPFILIHEGDKDLWIGKEIEKRIGQKINIIHESNALKIKGIIGVSEGVIGSRFHGLVSALSQGIPALAAGWSHKYEMLFEDYGFPDGILMVKSSYHEIQQKIDMLLSNIEKQKIKKKLIDQGIIQKQLSSIMWDTIFNQLL